MSGVVGGFAEAKAPDDDVKQLFSSDEVKAAVNEKLGSAAAEWEVVSVATQVVAGVNYRCKIKVGDAAFVHVKAFRPLPHTGEPFKVNEVETGKSLEDAL
jgi:cystatin-A/B